MHTSWFSFRIRYVVPLAALLLATQSIIADDTFRLMRLGTVPMIDHGRIFHDEPTLLPFSHEQPSSLRSRFATWSAEHTTHADVAQQIPTNGPLRLSTMASIDIATSTINPPDNAMAMGSGGVIVCAINSQIFVVDTTGTVLFRRGLDGFLSNAVNGQILSRFFCDPRVVFDHESQRFIVTAMTCEGRSSTSQIIIAVSNTEDPLGVWTLYQVQPAFSPPLSARTWFDFPAVAITSSDVFLSANLFDDSFSYRQPVVLQLNKAPLLRGAVPSGSDFRSFLNLSGDPYALFPIRIDTDRGSAMLMISNGFGNDEANSIRLYEFSGSIRDGNTQVNSVVTPVPSFQPPGFSPQPQSTVVLSCFDQRGAGGVWLGSTLHYVFGIRGPAGNAGIMYLALQRSGNAWRTTGSRIITRANSNIAYPSIAPIVIGGRKQTVLTYLFSSASESPGIAACLVDSLLNLSPEHVVRPGDGPVEFQSVDDFSRWADYISTVQSESNPAEVWLFAPYGNRSKSWSNILARLLTNTRSTSVLEPSQAGGSLPMSPSLRASMSGDEVAIELHITNEANVTIDLHSVTGAHIQRLFDGGILPGIHQSRYSLSNISAGPYLLVARTNSGHTSSTLLLR